MKHFTSLALAAALLVSSAVAQAQTAPAAEWAKFVTGETTTGTGTIGIATNESGTATYWAGSIATKAVGDKGFYDGEAVFESPAATERTNNNLVVLGINSAGTTVWKAYTNYADVISNNGGVVIMPDNSIVIAALVRHDPLTLDKEIVFYDATGAKISMIPAVAEYHNIPMLIHLTPEGKYIDGGYVNVDVPTIGETVVRAGVTIDGITASPDGCVLIYGNQRVTFNFYKEDGSAKIFGVSDETLEGWDGDPQKEAGSMYILKLHTNGEYININRGLGSGFTNGHISNAVFDKDGTLYIYGKYSVVEGASSYDGHLTGTTTTFSQNGVSNLFIARSNTNITYIRWVKNIIGEKVNNSCIVQNSGLTLGNGNLWLAAQYSGKFYPEGDDSKAIQSTLKVREGMLVRFDPVTGDWIKGISSYDSFTANGLTAYQDAIITPKAADKIYVFGYMMNAATGVFLRGYDVETLKADTDNAWSLVTGVKGESFNAAVPLAFNLAYSPKTGTIFTDARGKGGMCAAGLPAASSGTAFGIQLAKFQLDQSIFGSVSDITVDSDENAPVEYYDLQGRRVSDTPAAGLYIRRQGTQATKVLVR